MYSGQTDRVPPLLFHLTVVRRSMEQTNFKSHWVSTQGANKDFVCFKSVVCVCYKSVVCVCYKSVVYMYAASTICVHLYTPAVYM